MHPRFLMRRNAPKSYRENQLSFNKRAIKSIKSMIYYVLISENDKVDVIVIVIDEDRIMAHYQTMKTKGNSSGKMVSDHNEIWMKLNLLPEYTENNNEIEIEMNSKSYELFKKEIKKLMFHCNKDEELQIGYTRWTKLIKLLNEKSRRKGKQKI